MEQPRVVWRSLERHLVEAELALNRFEAGWSSATLTLNDVARGPEGALRAHIDGLVMGGAAAVERLLAPVLAAPKPPPARVTIALIALLLAGRAEFVPRALSHKAPAVQRAALRACALAAGASLDAWIHQSLQQQKPPAPRALLLELAAARGLQLESLSSALTSHDPAELAAALRVAVHAEPRAHEGRVRELLSDPRAEVRDAALVTALHHGSAHGWALCRALALDAERPHPAAMVLLAGLGEPSQHHWLAAMVGRRTHATATLRALGYSGNVDVAPLLLYHAVGTDEALSEVARDALAVLLGPEVDVVAASEEGVAGLPGWWNESRTRWDVRERVLAGLPATMSAFVAALLCLPTKRRFFTSLLLSVRTAGAVQIRTRALSNVQRAQLAAGAEQPGERWVREFTHF